MFEILACGRLVLASLEGEAALILGESGAAIVAPPEDVEALVLALTRLAGDPQLRDELAARGRPYVAENFDRRRLASRYLEVLQGVLRAPAL
jgi:glycosyltransferase involved in cell wall biosynthesis